ncbi:MAG: ABC transporter transmembrane domain-containing protein, partial [Thermoproteota archaeon]
MSSSTRHPFLRLFGYVRRERVLLLGGLATILLNTMLSVVSPIIAGRVVDITIVRALSELWPYAVAIIVLTLSTGGVSFISSYLEEVLAQRIVYRIRINIYAHLQDLSYSFYDRFDAGQIISRVTRDTEIIGRLLGFAFPNLIGSISTLAFVVTILLTTNLELALIALAITPV